MKPKKAQLVKLLDNRLILIPLEEVKNGLFDWDNRDKNCEIIKINPPKVNLWVYRKNAGNDILGNKNHIANPPTEEEVKKILNENQGICFIEVNSNNELSAPSNARGNRSIVIHLTSLVKKEELKKDKKDQELVAYADEMYTKEELRDTLSEDAFGDNLT